MTLPWQGARVERFGQMRAEAYTIRIVGFKLNAGFLILKVSVRVSTSESSSLRSLPLPSCTLAHTVPKSLKVTFKGSPKESALSVGCWKVILLSNLPASMTLPNYSLIIQLPQKVAV